jgi:stringent starvation protein B
MAEVSTKPYFIRAIYEWCSDCGYTPYLSVRVDDRTRVPMEYVKNGEIVLNVSLNATRNLTINNELIQFSARFNGVSREVSIPVDRVQGIFARENGQGAFFTVETPAAVAAAPSGTALAVEPEAEPPKPPAAGKSRLKLVK